MPLVIRLKLLTGRHVTATRLHQSNLHSTPISAEIASTLDRIHVERLGKLIPVNAGVPSVEIIMVPEHDTRVNPLGVKGIGEIGIVGMNAAVANAVFHATGKRLRELPIRAEHLL